MFYIPSIELTHPVEENKVNELVQSILENGWTGAPIIYFSGGLLTGNHRTAALEKILEMYENEELTEEQEKRMKELDESEIYYDADWIIEEKQRAFREEEQGVLWTHDELGPLFEGTDLEQWKDEIEEW